MSNRRFSKHPKNPPRNINQGTRSWARNRIVYKILRWANETDLIFAISRVYYLLLKFENSSSQTFNL